MKRHLFLLVVVMGMEISNPTYPQSLSDKVIYSRADEPHGSIWINDGSGMDSMLFSNGQAPKIAASGNHFLYMKNTSPSNFAYGGQWMRWDAATWNDTLLFNNPDYIVGYDFLESDSSYVISYQCGVYHDQFNGTYINTVTTSSCYDDGPDIRQSDSLVVFHNVLASLRTVKLDGTSFAAIPNTTSYDVWPVWSPDGHWILFGRYNNVNPARFVNFYKIKANGDSLTALTFNSETDSGKYTCMGAWTADGKRFVTAGYFNGSYGLLNIHADGSGITNTIYTSPGTEINFISASGGLNVPVPTGGTPLENIMSLFPNPSDGRFTLRVTAHHSAAEIKIVNWMGQVVFSECFRLDHGKGDLLLDLQGKPAGGYLLILNTGEKLRSMQLNIVR